MRQTVDQWPFNEEATKIKQEDPTQRVYVEWAKQHGIIMDKVMFPTCFGLDAQSPLVGSSAKEHINYNEGFIFVPNKLLITVERARSSEIGYIFENHDAMFKANQERDFKILLVFLMFEHQQGAKSFWHPYFEAVDPGELPCYWEENLVKAIDDRELREEMIRYKETMDEDWTQLEKLLKIYSPDHFDMGKCTYELYRRCSALIATRCFGWGLPTTIIVPIVDSFNHHAKGTNMIDIVNKRLHLQQNKIYLYSFNFDHKGEDPYDRSTSKAKFNVTKLFKEDQSTLTPEDSQLIQGETLTEDEIKDRYDEGEVFERFKNLLQAEQNPDLFDSEEDKRKHFTHGLELWGLGYVSSDNDQDDDEDGEEDDADESSYNEMLKRRILETQGDTDFTLEEFEHISSNSRLREIYNFRWWTDSDDQTYFVMVCKNVEGIKPREQIFYNYGRRTNGFLLENYGFTLDSENPYDSLEFRVTLSTNPKSQINHASELFPDTKTLEDHENLNVTTEKIRVKPYRISESLFSYLRSVLQNNYNGPDSAQLMVSSPRVIEFELLVVDFALDMLEHYGKTELFKKTSLEEDRQALSTEKDYRMKFVIQHNLNRKIIFYQHQKLLRVLKAILEEVPVSQDFRKLTFKRIPDLEENDSDYELFKRRMGMRNYFKELKMNIARIKKAKGESTGGPAVEKKPKKKVVKAAVAQEGGEQVPREKSPTKKPSSAQGGIKASLVKKKKK